MRRLPVRATLLTCIALLWAIAAWAQEAPKEFVPADTVARQELPSGPLVYAAYSFVWVAVVVYVVLLWRRIARVERELADVNRKLARR